MSGACRILSIKPVSSRLRCLPEKAASAAGVTGLSESGVALQVLFFFKCSETQPLAMWRWSGQRRPQRRSRGQRCGVMHRFAPRPARHSSRPPSLDERVCMRCPSCRFAVVAARAGIAASAPAVARTAPDTVAAAMPVGAGEVRLVPTIAQVRRTAPQSARSTRRSAPRPGHWATTSRGRRDALANDSASLAFWRAGQGGPESNTGCCRTSSRSKRRRGCPQGWLRTVRHPALDAASTAAASPASWPRRTRHAALSGPQREVGDFAKSRNAASRRSASCGA